MDTFARDIGNIPDDDVVVGIANIMPAKARRATSEQFAGLLKAASKTRSTTIRYFSCCNGQPVADIDFGLDGGYEDLEVIRDARLDGLIVTGLEPQAACMTDEYHWPTLAALIDWAADNTISTMWSCFAAHAAAFRLDGLVRQSLPDKLSGVFECAKASEHWLLSGVPARWSVPHSRYNTLNEDNLLGNGYQILSRGDHVGADMFVKYAGNSLFLFLQGHAEYGPESLMREYRRDIRRFLLGERDTYPAMPQNIFDQNTAKVLTALRQRALQQPSVDLLSGFDAAVGPSPAPGWRETAERFYANWLSYLSERKAERGELASERDLRKLAYP